MSSDVALPKAQSADTLELQARQGQGSQVANLSPSLSTKGRRSPAARSAVQNSLAC